MFDSQFPPTRKIKIPEPTSWPWPEKPRSNAMSSEQSYEKRMCETDYAGCVQLAAQADAAIADQAAEIERLQKQLAEQEQDPDDTPPPPTKTVGTVRVKPGETRPAPVMPIDWGEDSDCECDALRERVAELEAVVERLNLDLKQARENAYADEDCANRGWAESAAKDARIAELEAELHNANESLPPGGLTRNAYEKRIAELEAVVGKLFDAAKAYQSLAISYLTRKAPSKSLLNKISHIDLPSTRDAALAAAEAKPWF